MTRLEYDSIYLDALLERQQGPGIPIRRRATVQAHHAVAGETAMENGREVAVAPGTAIFNRPAEGPSGHRWIEHDDNGDPITMDAIVGGHETCPWIFDGFNGGSEFKSRTARAYHRGDTGMLLDQVHGRTVVIMTLAPGDYLVAKASGAYEAVSAKDLAAGWVLKAPVTPALVDHLLKDLPAGARVLVEHAGVRVMGGDDPNLPAAIADAWQQKRPAAVTHRSDDGVITIAMLGQTVDRDHFAHEMIHAAQCHATPEILDVTLRAAADEGRALVRRIKATAGPYLEKNHQDVHWMAKSIKFLGTVPGHDEMKEAVHDILNMAFMLAGSNAREDRTQEIARTVFDITDPAAVVAVMAAHFVLEQWPDFDSSCAAAREMVAHRYAGDVRLPVMEELFEYAAERACSMTIPDMDVTSAAVLSLTQSMASP